DEVEVAAELEHRMLADRMVGGEEGAELQTWHGRVSWLVVIVRPHAPIGPRRISAASVRPTLPSPARSRWIDRWAWADGRALTSPRGPRNITARGAERVHATSHEPVGHDPAGLERTSHAAHCRRSELAGRHRRSTRGAGRCRSGAGHPLVPGGDRARAATAAG